MGYIPQAVLRIPNTEAIDTPYLGSLDPSGKAGHGFLYADYIWASSNVLIWDPCPFG